MQLLLARRRRWRFLINLSAADYPLLRSRAVRRAPHLGIDVHGVDVARVVGAPARRAPAPLALRPRAVVRRRRRRRAAARAARRGQPGRALERAAVRVRRGVDGGVAPLCAPSPRPRPWGPGCWPLSPCRPAPLSTSSRRWPPRTRLCDGTSCRTRCAPCCGRTASARSTRAGWTATWRRASRTRPSASRCWARASGSFEISAAPTGRSWGWPARAPPTPRTRRRRRRAARSPASRRAHATRGSVRAPTTRAQSLLPGCAGLHQGVLARFASSARPPARARPQQPAPALRQYATPGILPIGSTEYAFILLLLRKRYNDVKRMISQSRLKGHSIISYLQKKRFPEVGLHFVNCEKTRLALALESGAVETALEAAEAIGDNDAFHRLASAALKQGKLEVFELCSQRTKDLDRLALLYVMTGKFEKLAKVRKIADARGHLSARFQICRYLGDVEGRISVLRDCGQLAMAILTAKSHGMVEELEKLGSWDDLEVTVDSSWSEGELIMPSTFVRTDEKV
ncbi:Coatomer subunit alpha WD40 repeat containing protein [Gracilaria domingensis]|nr:Coatomer subunit alpha WD40 repeat containing protein [Gracilaria domingensis]